MIGRWEVGGEGRRGNGYSGGERKTDNSYCGRKENSQVENYKEMRRKLVEGSMKDMNKKGRIMMIRRSLY